MMQDHQTTQINHQKKKFVIDIATAAATPGDHARPSYAAGLQEGLQPQRRRRRRPLLAQTRGLARLRRHDAATLDLDPSLSSRC